MKYTNLLWLFLFCFVSSPLAFSSEMVNGDNPHVDIWNPSKVDWWVSLDNSILSGQQACEIHWLYDDALNVVLTVNQGDRLFFTFRVNPENKAVVPGLNLQAGMAQKAALSIDGVKHSLGLVDIDLPPTVVIVGIPKSLNSLEYMQDAERLLLNISGAVYNFPLENMDENINYFKKCLRTLGRELPVSLASPDVSNTATTYDRGGVSDLLPQKAIHIAPKETVQPGADGLLSVEPKEDNLTKQNDDILSDATYSGIKKPSIEKNVEKTPRSDCHGDTYNEQGTAVVHNLMRKLKILEKEKEELRTKLMVTSSSGTIPQILECGSESLEEEDTSIADEVVAKFEVTISNLRAENEILNEALNDLEDTEDATDDVRQLENQLSELVKQNHKLQNDLFEYELKSVDEDKIKNESKALQGPEIDKDLLKTNDLVDSLSQNVGKLEVKVPAALESPEASTEKPSSTPSDVEDVIEGLPLVE